MTHTTNFRRGLCFLLACLVLAFMVIPPVVASAATVTANKVGIPEDEAMPFFMVLLGIYPQNTQLRRILNDEVYYAIYSYTETIDGVESFPAYEYNGTLYVNQEIISTAVVALQQYFFAEYGNRAEKGWGYENMHMLYFNDGTKFVLWNDQSSLTYYDDTTTGKCSVNWTQPAYYYTKINGQEYTEEFAPQSTSMLFQSNIKEYEVIRTAPEEIASQLASSGRYFTENKNGHTIFAVPVSRLVDGPETNDSGEDVSTEDDSSTSPTTPGNNGGGNTGTDLSGVTSRLDSIKSTLGSIGISIREQVVGGISQLKTAVSNGVTSITNAISGVTNGITSMVNFFTGTSYVESPTVALKFGSLFDLFPFNIPKGIYDAISFWEASASPPVITIPLPNYAGGGMDIYEFEINFSEIPGMDALAALIRSGELILFVVGLVILTEKVTKW